MKKLSYFTTRKSNIPIFYFYLVSGRVSSTVDDFNSFLVADFNHISNTKKKKYDVTQKSKAKRPKGFTRFVQSPSKFSLMLNMMS
mmetsp:Transcript_12548/g.14387  ORF Transcript_12548/g.14387 Transcript_12548/m.14387 type:complete len:85 (-) Transcript_12548:1524-1778(-)